MVYMCRSTIIELLLSLLPLFSYLNRSTEITQDIWRTTEHGVKLSAEPLGVYYNSPCNSGMSSSVPSRAPTRAQTGGRDGATSTRPPSMASRSTNLHRNQSFRGLKKVSMIENKTRWMNYLLIDGLVGWLFYGPSINKINVCMHKRQVQRSAMHDILIFRRTSVRARV